MIIVSSNVVYAFEIQNMYMIFYKFYQIFLNESKKKYQSKIYFNRILYGSNIIKKSEN